MYTIDQEIANKIARTTQMLYPKMRELFQATEEQANEMEDEIRQEIEKETGDPMVARAVVAYLALYLENRAITKFINMTGKQSLRAMMPEILTSKEAALIAQRDFMTMDNFQTHQTSQIIKDYQKRLHEVY